MQKLTQPNVVIQVWTFMDHYSMYTYKTILYQLFVNLNSVSPLLNVNNVVDVHVR